jgi:hypothetical protein
VLLCCDSRNHRCRGIDANWTHTSADISTLAVHALPAVEVRPWMVARGYGNSDAMSMATARLGSLVKSAASLSPRFIRLRDAPLYLAMDKNRFNREVRPQLTNIPIGSQGIAFDRLELDAWAEDYVRRNGRPAALPEGRKSWDNVNRPASPCEVRSGTSTKTSTERAFARALAQAISGKP